jgi:hypothetical protein
MLNQIDIPDPESDSTVGAAASSSETTTALNLAIPPKQPAQSSRWQRWHSSTTARNILRQDIHFRVAHTPENGAK